MNRLIPKISRDHAKLQYMNRSLIKNNDKDFRNELKKLAILINKTEYLYRLIVREKEFRERMMKWEREFGQIPNNHGKENSGKF